MRRICLTRFWLGLAPVLFVAAATACGDGIGLPAATIPNRIDTTTLYALQGTPIATPSAYDIVQRVRVRTDQTSQNVRFDFGFDITPAGEAQILPGGLLGEAPAGILPMTVPFESIVRAPEQEGYVRDSAVTIQVGSVFVGQSRSSGTLCSFLGSLPRYGKFRVLALDMDERTVTLEALVDVNCGYRGLEPGLPES